MKVKAVFEFNYPDDEKDFKVYSKAHEMHALLLDLLARIKEGKIDEDNPEFLLLVVEDKIKALLKDME